VAKRCRSCTAAYRSEQDSIARGALRGTETAHCQRCLSTFERTTRHRKFCSTKCKTIGFNERRKAANRHRIGDVTSMRCEYCCSVFVYDPVKAHRGRKFCSMECARDSAKERRRARRIATTVEPISRPRVYDRDGWICQICCEPVDPAAAYPDPRSASLDHVVPLSRGGTHTYDNVQCSHLECNVRKGAGV